MIKLLKWGHFLTRVRQLFTNICWGSCFVIKRQLLRNSDLLEQSLTQRLRFPCHDFFETVCHLQSFGWPLKPRFKRKDVLVKPDLFVHHRSTFSSRKRATPICLNGACSLWYQICFLFGDFMCMFGTIQDYIVFVPCSTWVFAENFVHKLYWKQKAFSFTTGIFPWQFMLIQLKN